MIFVCYPRCTTCQKAKKWLEANNITFEERHIQKEMKEKKIDEISTTDPDARLMKVNNNGADVCYNVQTAIDQKNKLLVDYDVINNAADQGNLYEMAKKAKETLGVEEIKALADKGYYSTLDLKKCEKNKIET
jgi:glutaredoxin-related protein